MKNPYFEELIIKTRIFTFSILDLMVTLLSMIRLCDAYTEPLISLELTDVWGRGGGARQASGNKSELKKEGNKSNMYYNN
jgi:hypothetical protein